MNRGIKVIFETKQFVVPTEDEMGKILKGVSELLNKDYEIEITDIQEIEDGQNLNYFIEGYEVSKSTSKNENVRLFLKIISKDGYPDVGTLNRCYELLNLEGFEYYNIIYYDTSSIIAPYGFIVQKWIDGDVRISNNNRSLKFKENEEIPWLKDYAQVLKKVHSIKFNYFGDIKGIVKFDTIHEYYENMDEVIRWSFGDVKDGGIILSDLVDHEVLDEEFLKYVLKGISHLGRQIPHKESVLIYGDMFPSNIIYKDDEPKIIDWDECRANWWVYEIARTTYYIESTYVAEKFIEYYRPHESIEEIDIGIRIEHIKQHLRKLCIMCMNRNKDKQLMEKVENIKKSIIERLENNFLVYYRFTLKIQT